MASLHLLALLMALLAVVVSGNRCEVDEHCGLAGVCDRRLGCCVVRGCPFGCPAGQVCQFGHTACGKFTKLLGTCACPRKMGCVWRPERRVEVRMDEVEVQEEVQPERPRGWLDMFYDVL